MDPITIARQSPKGAAGHLFVSRQQTYKMANIMGVAII